MSEDIPMSHAKTHPDSNSGSIDLPHSDLPGKIIVLVILAAVGVFAYRKLTVQPVITPSEAFVSTPEQTATIDHGPFNDLLATFVRNGVVDYTGLKTRATDLDAYLTMLASLDPDAYDRDEKLALYINAYNAATLRLVLNYWPGLGSIKELPNSKRWKDKRWRVAGKLMSLDEIEHQVLRSKFKEPRIHFAIVCASIGCPILRSEAFVASRINVQLEDQTHLALNDPRYLQWDPASRTLRVTKIFNWFREDFQQGDATIVDFIAARLPDDTARAIRSDRTTIRVDYLDWDWTINGK